MPTMINVIYERLRQKYTNVNLYGINDLYVVVWDCGVLHYQVVLNRSRVIVRCVGSEEYDQPLNINLADPDLYEKIDEFCIPF